MVRYFFDIRDDTGLYADEEGLEFRTQREAEIEATQTLSGLARDLASHEDRTDVAIEVRTDAGRVFKPPSSSSRRRRSNRPPQLATLGAHVSAEQGRLSGHLSVSPCIDLLPGALWRSSLIGPFPRALAPVPSGISEPLTLTHHPVSVRREGADSSSCLRSNLN